MMKWTLQKFKLDQLTDYHKNPRKLTKEQHVHLKASIEKFGLIDKPICTKDGLIIGGHQRKNILKKLGIKEVECYVPDEQLDAQQIEELNIRLNKNGGSFDFDILANEFEQNDLINWGFTHFDLESFMVDEENKTKKPQKDKQKLVCPNCGCDIG